MLEALPSHSEYHISVTHAYVIFYFFIYFFICFELVSRLPFLFIGTPQTKGKGKESPMILKRQSMRILQTRFANTRKGMGKSSRPQVVVTVDDDDESDDGDVVETETGTCEQESSSLDEGLDTDQNYNHDEGAYIGPDTRSEEPNDLDMPPELASDHEWHVNVECVAEVSARSPLRASSVLFGHSP